MMMKKILVFGGNRFFGQKTVQALIQKGYLVTIANRGVRSDDFGDNVNRIMVDRTDPMSSGWQEISQSYWDVVIDNICYTKEEAQIAIDYLTGKVGQYLFTSSLSVYEGEQIGFSETDFRPDTFIIDPASELNYSEGKRQAEATFVAASDFPVAILRIPIVLDDDDYTERLHYYIRKIRNEETILVRDLSAQMSFIKGSEVAKVMLWLIDINFKGVINASSKEIISMNELMNWIEEVVKVEPLVIESDQDENQSPFSIEKDWYLDCQKMSELGYPLPDLSSWLVPLIRRLNEKMAMNA